MSAKWMTALVVVAAAATLAPGRAQAAGTTQISIGNPTYTGNPPTQAQVPITMELDSTTKGFLGLSVTVTKPGLFGKQPVPVIVGPYNAPQPGKGQQTVQIYFPVTAGVTYTMNASMSFTDAQGNQATMPATPAIFTP